MARVVWAMRTLKLTLAYDGTRFVGWQRQAAGESIQGLLESAMARLEGRSVTVHGAGRTDAGVHARGQVASVEVTFDHDPATVARALNGQLPEDVRVLEVVEAAEGFHARFSARSKTYAYRIRISEVADPFDRAYAWHVRSPLDLEAMRRAAALLIGTHDFAAFQSAGTEVRTTGTHHPPVGGRARAGADHLRDRRRRLPAAHGAGHRRHARGDRPRALAVADDG